MLFDRLPSYHQRELPKDDSLFIRNAVEVGGNLTAQLAVTLYCCTLPRPVFAPYAGRVKNTEGNSMKTYQKLFILSLLAVTACNTSTDPSPERPREPQASATTVDGPAQKAEENGASVQKIQ